MANPFGIYDDSGIATVTTTDDTLTALVDFDFPVSNSSSKVDVSLTALCIESGEVVDYTVGRGGLWIINNNGTLLKHELAYGETLGSNGYLGVVPGMNASFASDGTSSPLMVQGAIGRTVVWKARWTRQDF